MSAPDVILPPPGTPEDDPAWRLFYEALEERVPRLGTALFSAMTSVAVTLQPAMPDDDYHIDYELPADRRAWTTGKTALGFTINVDAALTGTVGWKITRR